MKQCEKCGKGSIMRAGRKKLRGNYNPTPLKRKYPNLQSAKLSDGRHVLLCTKCRRTLHKV